MEINTEELQRLGERVESFITRYLSALDSGPALPPGLTPGELRRLLAEPLPKSAQGIDAAFDDFIEKVAAGSARVGHPRFLGWIRTSPLAAAIYAEALAAALNQSVAVWEGAPAATEVELRVIEWLKELSGYAPESGGILTSGGSAANFIALLAARQVALPDVRQTGLAGAPPLSVYLTRETHYCIPKAVEMMGLGQASLRFIPTDDRFRMDADALRRQIQADRRDGRRPMAVAATLGTVNSGACDDLLGLGAVCREEHVWLHVDGAYGGIAHLVPGKEHLATGLAEADSFTFDPHKSLFIPFEAGLALLRDPKILPATFSMQTSYLPNSPEAAFADGRETDRDGLPLHFRDYGPQLSRGFRALKIYLTLKTYGTDALGAAQARLFGLAAGLGERLQAEPDFELLAPVVLGTVAFRYRPAGEAEDAERTDRLNEEIASRLRQEGNLFVTTTRLRGRTALRACFVSHRTQPEDLDFILTEVRRQGEAINSLSPG